MDSPEETINGYLSKEFNNFAFKFNNQDNLGNITKIDSNISNKSLTSIIDGKRKNFLFSVIGEKNINLEQKEPAISYLKIYDIHKNENYGGLYMHHGKRSPFEVKVKTKRVKLYVIKKDDYSNICVNYKNFIERIHKKEKKNIKHIKNVLIKTIDRFCHAHGINIKEEYRALVEKAIKDFNINSLPDFLKNNSAFANLFTNEIDEEISKTIKEFSTKLFKVSTTKSKFNFKAYKTLMKSRTKLKLTAQQTLEKKMLDNINKQRKSLNINMRPKKRSYNFTIKGNLGANIIQSFKPIYQDDFYVSKPPPVNVEELNNKLYKRINDEKNRLNEIRKNKIENKLNEVNKEFEMSKNNSINENNIGENNINESNVNEYNINEYKIDECNINEYDEIKGINEAIKINKLKPICNIKASSHKSLKNYTFKNSDSEKASKKTIKLKCKDKESRGKDPITLKDLPESLQEKLKNKFKNKQMQKNKDDKLKIENIKIEINDCANNNADYSNNNSLFDNSNLNIINNISYYNINKYNNLNKTFNFGINKGINKEKNNLRKYIKSSSYSNKNKKNTSNSPETLKYNKKKSKPKVISSSVKHKVNISKIKTDNTNQNSTKLTLTPIISSNIFSQMNNINNLSPMNKFKRSSLTENKNFLLKLNGELDKKSDLIIDELSSTSVESFQIKRSYKNLNQESGGTYIKNKKLQNKTIKFIKDFENNNKSQKKKKDKGLKGRLTGNFDIQTLMKANKEEENQFKKLENAVRRVKTKMSNILLKKKRRTQKNLNQISSQRESLKLNYPSPRGKKKKSIRKKLTLNSFNENNNFSGSNLKLNNLCINQDDTLSKLNISNNEITEDNNIDKGEKMQKSLNPNKKK